MNEEELNDYKKAYKQVKGDMRKLCRILARHVPREELVEELKKRKIIKRDWVADGEQYEERN